MIEFVRAAGNFVKAVKKEDYHKAEIWLRSMKQERASVNEETSAGETVLSALSSMDSRQEHFGWDHPGTQKSIKHFRVAFKAFRAEYELHIENQHMKHILNILLPFTLDRLRSRGINVFGDLSIAATMEKLIANEPAFGIEELAVYKKLAESYRDMLKQSLKGEKVKKSDYLAARDLEQKLKKPKI